MTPEMYISQNTLRISTRATTQLRTIETAPAAARPCQRDRLRDAARPVCALTRLSKPSHALARLLLLVCLYCCSCIIINQQRPVHAALKIHRHKGGTSASHQQNQTRVREPVVSIRSVDRPSCQLGDESFALGRKWTPTLSPSGPQYCVACECTLKLSATQNCYEPKVVCAHLAPAGGETPPASSCPPLPASCPDGRRPEPMPDHNCCLACPPVPGGTGGNAPAGVPVGKFAKLPRFKSGVAWSRRSSSDQQRISSASTSGVVRPATTTTQRPMSSYISEINFDSAARPESLWLFKVIAKTSDSRELISAVKSVPLCPVTTRVKS